MKPPYHLLGVGLILAFVGTLLYATRDHCDHDKADRILTNFELASKWEKDRALQGDFSLSQLLPRGYLLVYERNALLDSCGCSQMKKPYHNGIFLYGPENDPSVLYVLLDRYEQLQKDSTLNEKEKMELEEAVQLLCYFTQEQDGVDACPEETSGPPLDVFRVDHAIRSAIAAEQDKQKQEQKS